MNSIRELEEDIRGLTEAIKTLSQRIESLITSHLKIIYALVIVQAGIIFILLGAKDLSFLKSLPAIAVDK